MNSPVEYFAFALRYYPNLITGEFLNVGVALVCPSSRWWDVRVASGLKGFRRVFPTAQPDVLKAALTRIRRSVERVEHRRSARIQLVGDLRGNNDWASPLGRVTAVVGPLVGSIRWSPDPVEGITLDPEHELDYWFEQLVHIADEPTDGAASENRVKGVPGRLRQELESRGLLSRLHPAEVGSYYKEQFNYTFTNGRLHVFEAIRLNYRKPANIRAQAQLWRGKLDSLNDGMNQKLNFFAVVDVPRISELRAEAELGLAVIQNAHANRIETFTADRMQEFGELAERIVTHKE
jgi:hypothetical protein